MKPSTLLDFRNDTNGTVISTELIFVALLALLGLIVGSVSIRDAVVAELADVAGMGQDLSQSFHYDGTVNSSASVAGSSMTDATDFGDIPEDISGNAESCITLTSLPLNEGETVSSLELIAEFNFDADSTDSSTSGQDNSGNVVGNPIIGGGVATFDGNDQIRIPNSPDINLGIHQTRTIVVEFTPMDVNTRQVIYEEGGGVRGLNIYIVDGSLYIGGWNIPVESGWAPSYVSTPIVANTSYQAALVLDGGAAVAPGALTGYVNGASIGSASGSQLWQHSGGIGIGGTNGRTIFHDVGNSNLSAGFIGTIQRFNAYNRALTASEAAAL